MFPEDAAQILDGGRAFNGGNPPAEISFNDAHVPNPQRNAPPQTILGAEQKAWFKDQLRKSTATWKIWGNSEGAPDQRGDPQNLPPGLTKETWPKTTYAAMSSGDYGTAYRERAEIYDLVRDEKMPGFAIVSGDRHSFWAGYATSELPPGKFDPVGLSFVGASLSSAGTMEAQEHNLPKDDPLRPLFLAGRGRRGKPDWTYNMLLKHGVRSCLEYAKSFDLKRAHAAVEPGTRPAPRVRRSWRPRVREGAARRPTKCGRSSSAFRARSRAAKDRTGGPSGIGYYTLLHCGRAESARS